MYPVVCQIGPVSIYSYGLALAVAVVVCTFLLSREARRLEYNVDMIIDFVFWIVVSGIIGARLFFVLLNLDYFITFPLDIIKVQNGGLSWQGGLIGGFLTGLYYIKKKQLPLARTLDLFAPYLALGQAIGRIGCFFNGCCYGYHVKEWGIFFPVHQDILFPTQLVSSLGLVIIYIVLRKFSKYAKISGEVFLLYLMLACGFRFLVEFFRADHYTTISGLSIFQYVCLIIVIASGYFWEKIHSAKRS